MIRGQGKAFGLLAGLSVVAAGLESAALLSVVPLATTIAGDRDRFTGSIAGFDLDVSAGVLAAISGGLVVARIATQLATAYLGAWVGVRFEVSARDQLFAGFLRSRWAWQSREKLGELQEALSFAVGRARIALKSASQAVFAATNLAALTVAAIIVDPRVAIALGVVVVAMFASFRPLVRRAAHHAHDLGEVNTELVTHVNESVGLARELRLFGATDGALARSRRLLRRFAHFRRAEEFLLAAMPALYNNLALAGLVGGLIIVRQLGLEIGSLAVGVLLLLRAMTYGGALQTAHGQVLDAMPFVMAVNRRIADYEASRHVWGATPVEPISSIEADQVWFAYPGREPVLRGLGLVAKRGDVIGVVGPSGAGKSTFLQLLLRLRTPDRGRLLVNGVPLEEIDEASWTRQVAYVPQEPELLHATVRDNIRFYRDHVSDEDIVRAAQLAKVHEDIVAWPDGYDTVVGTRGRDVSGGQRQRLCIARALAGGPSLLVLDEPTSALDEASERAIADTIDTLRGEMMIILVAHSPAVSAVCDRIVTVRNGVAAEGQHRAPVR